MPAPPLRPPYATLVLEGSIAKAPAFSVPNPELLALQLAPPSLLLYQVSALAAAQTMDGLLGSIASVEVMAASIPELAAFQLPAAFTLLKTPAFAPRNRMAELD